MQRSEVMSELNFLVTMSPVVVPLKMDKGLKSAAHMIGCKKPILK